jgi:hypothetical protein
MFARRVTDPNPNTGVQHVLEVKSPLNRNELLNSIADHPDRDFYKRIKDYSDNGVPVSYTGERHYRECDNWPSAYQYKDAVASSIIKDVQKGRKLGPFNTPPFSSFMGSPLGAFPKKRSIGKFRIIHDLSWPPEGSINSFIPDDECTLHYISIDNAVTLVNTYGIGTQLAKLDLEDAFKQIIVKPQDWDLLGSVWYNENNVKQYYVDTVLPFGLRTSPRRFNDFADALQFAMLKDGASDVCHYLDDYLTAGAPDSNQCHANLDIMINTCNRLGFAINYQKLIQPSTEIEFLGIILDTELAELRISPERLYDIKQDLSR